MDIAIPKGTKPNPDLNTFDSLMSDLVSNYVLVAGELGKTKDFSPLTAFDSYWDTYYNCGACESWS